MREAMILVSLFFCYSFMGWAWETFYVSLRQKKFAYRGFLVGPITPIYGFAILGALFLLRPFESNLLILFVGAMIVCTIVEYITSWGLEKLFNASWWDYHDVPLNINGRVALPISLFWGFCCVLIQHWVQPFLLQQVVRVIDATGYYIPIILMIITATDTVYTVRNMLAFKKAMLKFNTIIEEKKQELQDNLEEIKDGVTETAEHYRQRLKETRATWLQQLKKQPEKLQEMPFLNKHQKRWLRNFERLDFKKLPTSTDEVKNLVRELQKGVKKKS